MFEFHADRRRYFEMQVMNSEKYVLPFIENIYEIRQGMRVLEIGAGEGGVLKAFINRGCTGVAVELDENRVRDGKQLLKKDIDNGVISFFVNNIYDTDVGTLGGQFDIIVLKDVIEHIHDQARLIDWLHSFLKPGGVIYFGFPPWQMPYGGHQQMCQYFLAKVPYIHLLPVPLYRGLLKLFKEHSSTIENLLEVKETGISIEKFEKIIRKTDYIILNKKHYAINPIYQYKFGWKPREQMELIQAIPYVRNYLTTCVYYLVSSKTEHS
ncbi:MAG: class I SAM-dependent methyltransferase [Ginsengibacter sp.]